MGPMEAVTVVLTKKYATFSGRASRSEYWWFYLFYTICTLVIFLFSLSLSGYFSLLDSMASNDSTVVQEAWTQVRWGWLIIPAIWYLAMLLPSLAALVRRLHDRNLSGWWILPFCAICTILNLIPILGTILTLAMYIGALIILVLPGDAAPNRFGASPLNPAGSATVFS